MIHVVDNGHTLCSWNWDYLRGKRNDKKVPIEEFARATCSICKSEGKRRFTSQPRITTGGK